MPEARAYQERIAEILLYLKLKTAQQPSEARKRQGRNLFQSLQKKHGLTGILISDFQLPEL